MGGFVGSTWPGLPWDTAALLVTLGGLKGTVLWQWAEICQPPPPAVVSPRLQSGVTSLHVAQGAFSQFCISLD